MEKFLNVDRVAISINGYDIYWYGLIISSAIVVVILTAIVFCKIRKYELDAPINVALVILPAGILSGRLFSVIFEPDLSLSDYFNFRTGGMSIIGAIIGGAIAITIYSFIKKDKQFFKYFDILCSVLLLAQAIGRWGNFFNGEVYGQVIDASSKFARFPFAVEINGTLYQALFFYESVLDFIGFLFTAEIFLGIKKATGYTTAFYLMYYGTVRTVLEGFRNENYVLKLGSLRVSMLCSITMIVAGVALLVVSIILNKKNKLNQKGLSNG